MDKRLFGKEIHIPLNGLNVSRRLEYNLLMRYLDLKGTESLLDVACGDGFWTAKMLSQAASVVGFDYNFKRLRQAGNLASGMLGRIRNDAHVLPFADEKFDASVGICVLEHFQDDVKALSELRRVTKPGGKLALTVDSFSYPGISEAEKEKHAKKFSVVHLYKIETLTEKLKQAGYEVLQWTYLLRTPISANLYLQALRHPKLAYFVYPITYPLSLWSEQQSKNQECGHKLAVLARAV
ncbi:class I SAM-dependent methyltransferase [bacterium]|nr:class I SAM-dependent methyltransferase [bacterium]MBU1881812.1 class I SAM-dependent methyltransferase [bacterium]